MIPKNMMPRIEVVKSPSVTWEFDRERNRIGGKFDGIKTVEQAIYLILNTERYAYLIYSWDYGVELDDLIGRSLDYIMPEAKRRITEALMMDNRIMNVYDFEYKRVVDSLLIKFHVDTVYGIIQVEKVVNV